MSAVTRPSAPAVASHPARHVRRASTAPSRAVLLAGVTAAAVLLPAAAASAGGSDSPTPYSVTASALVLPTGTTFEANGHINYTVTKLDGTGATSFNVHESVPSNGLW